ncbi:YdcF family protein [Crenobacter luteus]|uniref:DUF218 domain-containing protein n=1 Tax=Crenobacter luteus TaxID=1452487 RepID=A0A165ENF7_9NEIS|nr:YdcF family protein [Crenobacter luteus]KZE27270.1 hypothetical protein AVW16_01605 [Crenobacter luteus]
MSGDTISPLVLANQLAGALFLPPLLWGWPLLGAWLARRLRCPRLSRLCVGVAILGLYLSSTPRAAMWLAEGLERDPPVSREALASVDAIVVLGGGKRDAPEYGAETVNLDTLSRLRYAAWLAGLSGKPLLVTGGAPRGGEPEAELMAGALESEFGRRVRWRESASRTTAENARFSATILRGAGVRRIALVSQAWHLRRAAGAFRVEGLEVVPAPTGFIRYEGPAALWWLPQGRAMQEVHSLAREYLGMLYYTAGRILQRS